MNTETSLSLRAPICICVFDDHILRIGMFDDRSASQLDAMVSDLLLIDEATRDGTVRYENWKSSGGTVLGNKAVHRLRTLVGRHMRYDEPRHVVLDRIGFELLLGMVTD